MHRHHLHRKRQRGKRTNQIAWITTVVMSLWILSNSLFLFRNFDGNNNGSDQQKAASDTPTKTTKTLRTFQKNKDVTHSQVGIRNEDDYMKSSSWILPREKTFFDTVTSCIPPDVATSITRRESDNKKGKCIQHTPDGTKAQRIGILSPPGAITDEFYNWVIDMLAKYFEENPDDSKARLKTEIELVSTSHAPPYGYGKSHGWTKIIRFVTDPIDIGVVDAVVHEGGERLQETLVSSTGEITRYGEERRMVSSMSGLDNGPDLMVELSSTLSQIVRWNCRISHVSAHTALLTVTLQELIKDPSQTVSDVLSFIFASGKDDEDGNPKDELMASNAQWIKNINTRKFKQKMEDVMKHGKSLFETTQSDFVSALKSLDLTLLEELETTGELKQWPCKSLWDVESSTASIKQRAQDLAPDCGADYTKCFVSIDKCEERGEIVCDY